MDEKDDIIPIHGIFGLSITGYKKSSMRVPTCDGVDGTEDAARAKRGDHGLAGVRQVDSLGGGRQDTMVDHSDGQVDESRLQAFLVQIHLHDKEGRQFDMAILLKEGKTIIYSPTRWILA